MGYIGTKPSAVPLTSADITDGIITSAKIADGTIVNADINASAGIVNSKLSGVGITMADQWRLTANVTTDTDITSNLERVDEASSGFIGTGMTESSGIFSFPSTGIYLVRLIANGEAVINDNISIDIKVTIDNSSYNGYATSVESGDAGTGFCSMACEGIIDVTDVSNVKVKFATSSIGAGSSILGNSNQNDTTFTFIRLGDT